jgi:hypothetical protein
MITKLSTAFKPRRTALAALLGSLGSAAFAQAQVDAPPPPPVASPPPITQPATPPVSPFSIGLSQTLTHESNIFRLSSGEESDWTSTTALNFALDEAFGRQRLRGIGSLQANRYRDHDELDNTGHQAGLELDWETVGELSGVLGVQSLRRQYQFGLDSASPFQGRNIESTQAANFRAQLGGMGLWSLHAGADSLERKYSDDTFDKLNRLSQWSSEGGIGYKPSPDLSTMLLFRYTRISRPDSDLGPGDDVARKEAELSANWQATGASKLDLRIGRADEKHSVAEDRGFWTGGIGWDWMPSGKLLLKTQLLRDAEGGSGSVIAPDTTGTAPARAGDLLRDAFIWTAQWAATSKINVTGGVEYSRRRYSDLIPDSTSHVVDRTTALKLGLRYSPQRWLDLGCDIGHEHRETNTVDQTVTRPYDSLVAGCLATLWFRP